MGMGGGYWDTDRERNWDYWQTNRHLDLVETMRRNRHVALLNVYVY